MRSGPVLCALLLTAAAVQPQQPSARPVFDVASIRLSNPNEVNGMIKPLPGGHGYTAHNISVKLMISLMYKVPMRQISGGPEWLNGDRYDVEARADGSYSLEQLQAMYQNLLADRFNLRFHNEPREGNVYALLVEPSGLKMVSNDTPQAFNIPVTFGANGLVQGRRVPMHYLTWWLGGVVDRDERPVVDRTGLTGNYDFTLDFERELQPDAPQPDLRPDRRPDRPSIFVALQQQLGLRLEPTRGPVDHYVIDHVDRPSAN